MNRVPAWFLKVARTGVFGAAVTATGRRVGGGAGLARRGAQPLELALASMDCPLDRLVFLRHGGTRRRFLHAAVPYRGATTMPCFLLLDERSVLPDHTLDHWFHVMQCHRGMPDGSTRCTAPS